MYKTLNFLLLFIPVQSVRKSLRFRLRHSRFGNQSCYRKAKNLTKWTNGKQIAGTVISTGDLLGKQFSFANVWNSKDGSTTTGLYEVFGALEYNFFQRPNTIIIDIGMNYGYASLYFSMRDDIKAVYGFEPVPAIYEKAVLNFELNSKLAKKITAHNFGLGNEDKQVTVSFNEYNSGVTSMHPAAKKRAKQVKITIKHATKQIQQIISDHPTCPIVMKCDCEGAESDIFIALDKACLLPKITEIIMEYHFSLDKEIELLLDKNSFVWRKNSTEKTYGIIHAIKK